MCLVSSDSHFPANTLHLPGTLPIDSFHSLFTFCPLTGLSAPCCRDGAVRKPKSGQELSDGAGTGCRGPRTPAQSPELSRRVVPRSDF